MGQPSNIHQGVKNYSVKRLQEICEAVKTNHVWSRMLKNTITTTLVGEVHSDHVLYYILIREPPVSICTIHPKHPPLGESTVIGKQSELFDAQKSALIDVNQLP